MDMPLIQKFRYFSCHILGILSARAVLIKFTFRLPLRKSDESYVNVSIFTAHAPNQPNANLRPFPGSCDVYVDDSDYRPTCRPLDGRRRASLSRYSCALNCG